MFVLSVFPARKRVLIDTWWNVNYFTSDFDNRLKRVLIDTWWNVNLLQVRKNKIYIMF